MSSLIFMNLCHFLVIFGQICLYLVGVIGTIYRLAKSQSKLWHDHSTLNGPFYLKFSTNIKRVGDL